ncbi:MAG TPA: nickel transporter permease [Anaerolineaceae bacterium]|nr:nickel transporter permease [Anaerolineaceae bacterium]
MNATQVAGLPTKTITNQRSAFRSIERFLKRNPLALVGIILVVATVLIAILANWITPYDPIKPVLLEKLQAPSAQHIFGTDDMGRDIFSRVLMGTRVSLISALIIIAISGFVGLLVGLAAGYWGGWIDDLLMRLTDIFLAFPALVLAMVISATLGPSLENALIAIATVWWPWYARLVRGQVIAARNKEYVTAATCLGFSPLRIIFRHILPNVLGPVIVQATLDVGNTILLTASLSFIGLGAQPPTPEWGAMVSIGRLYMLSYWWVPTIPGFAILLSVIGFNLLGDAVRDYSDVRSRQL